jgi:uncharacterized repeat protein (TIGR01451 family)
MRRAFLWSVARAPSLALRVSVVVSGSLVIAAAGVLLADSGDNFSAARKAQGVTRYSGDSSSSSAPRQTQQDNKDNSFAPPTVEIDGQTVSETPQSVMKGQNSGGAAEQAPSPQATSKPSPRPASGNDSSPSSGALKAFQQRMSAARKTNTGETLAAGPVAMPRVELPGNGSPQPPAGGPAEGSPIPPMMPDIRMAQRPAAAASPPISETMPPRTSEISAVPAIAAAPPLSAAPTASGPPTISTVQPTAGAGGPVVVGPVSSARRPAAAPIEEKAPEGVAGGLSVPTPPRAAEAASPVANLLFSQQSPSLDVKAAGPKSINVGKEAPYTVTVANAGANPVLDMIVSIKIPAWITVADSKGTNGAARPASDAAGQPLVWHIPRVEPRSKEQLVMHLVAQESRPFDLSVQWTFSPVASQAMVEVKEPKLTMSVSGPKEVVYGQTKVYKLALANPGTGDAENVVLFLSPVDGGSAPPTRHDLGSIRSGESKTVEVELTARQAGTLQMKAAAMADTNLRAEICEEIIVHRAGLKLAAVGPETKFTGTGAAFKVHVSNPGNATAENILLAAMLPMGAKYVSSTGGQYVTEQNKVTWSLPALRPGAEQEFEIRCTLTSAGANRFQVVGTAASDLSDTSAVTTNVEALADLKLEVSDPPGPIPVGEEATYEVHLRNRGTKAAENVDVAGYFSSGIEPVSAQGAAFDISAGQVVFRPIASIPPGTELVLRIKAKAEKPGTHVFRAEAVCSAAGTKLATEETTLYFGDSDHSAAKTAAKPGEAAGHSGDAGAVQR